MFARVFFGVSSAQLVVGGAIGCVDSHACGGELSRPRLATVVSRSGVMAPQHVAGVEFILPVVVPNVFVAVLNL